MGLFSFLPDDAEIGHLLFHDLRRFGHFQRFAHHAMRGDSSLSKANRELIAAYVSGLNACDFCFGVHQRTAEHFGVSAELLRAVIGDLDTAEVSREMRAILGYVGKLTHHPSKLRPSDAEAVYAAGVGERALHEAIVICSIFSCYNRLVDGHHIKGTVESYTASSGMLAKHGYRIPWFAKFFKS
ncbi:MAG: carboxymuconolactone decarboxylase family protein [Myxococcota bacterium]